MVALTLPKGEAIVKDPWLLRPCGESGVARAGSDGDYLCSFRIARKLGLLGWETPVSGSLGFPAETNSSPEDDN